MENIFPTEPQAYLKQEFHLRNERRPHYSMRAFARDLGLSASTLSEFINGKQGISLGTARTISQKIHLSSEDEEHFLDLVKSQCGRSREEKAIAQARIKSRIFKNKSQLALDQFQLISEWYHFAILELVDLNSEYHNEKAISKVLGIPVKKAKEAVQRLVRIHLLDCNQDLWRTLTAKTHVGEEVPSDAIQNFHKEILSKAKESLKKDNLHEREFQSVIFSMRSKDIPQFKKDLESSWRQLLGKYIHKDSKDKLMCLGLQFFGLEKANLKKVQSGK